MSHRTFLDEHFTLTRRFFVQAGGMGLVAAFNAATALGASTLGASTALRSEDGETAPARREKPDKAGVRPDPYLTPAEDFKDVSRGKPLPHSLPDDRKREVGLTRDTWQLEVVSDPDNPAKLGKQLTKDNGTALDFAALLRLGETSAVRFAKVMTCLNLGCPLGMGLWEGVPLRDVVWLTQPRENLRRVFYYGFHNDDPKQMFRSSLPIGRVLEDPPGDPPVILCFKLNGELLSGKRGGPVRMVVPEAYGFKSVKWLQRVVLTNAPFANDTYADGNNDVDSWMKTFAKFVSPPDKAKAGEPIPLTGLAQVGISGLSKVQYWFARQGEAAADGDPHFTAAPWREARILAAPERWRPLPDAKLPSPVHGFDAATSRPNVWPMRYSLAHWAALAPPLAAGKYELRCRTIDAQGIAQPMPRPFPKSGRNAIQQVVVTVEA